MKKKIILLLCFQHLDFIIDHFLLSYLILSTTSFFQCTKNELYLRAHFQYRMIEKALRMLFLELHLYVSLQHFSTSFSNVTSNVWTFFGAMYSFLRGKIMFCRRYNYLWNTHIHVNARFNNKSMHFLWM